MATNHSICERLGLTAVRAETASGRLADLCETFKNLRLAPWATANLLKNLRLGSEPVRS